MPLSVSSTLGTSPHAKHTLITSRHSRYSSGQLLHPSFPESSHPRPSPDKADSPSLACTSLYSPNYARLICATLGAGTCSGPRKGYSHDEMDTKHKLIMLVTAETQEDQQVSVCCGHCDFVIGTSDISGHSTDLVQADSSCSFPLWLILEP